MKVKQFATVVSGATPSKKHPEYYGGDIVWFTPKDLSDSGKKYMKRGQLLLTKDGFDSCSASMIPAHSVLMSSRAPIGLLAINETECCTNQGFKSIVPNQEICLTEYLYYYLKQNIKAVESLGSGTTFKEVDKASLEDMNIELPSIAEQHAVSSVLSVLDDAIDNNNSVCADLEAAAKLLYDYWFVQFDFPDENGKPYKSSGGKMVWNDELKREIPAGWSCVQLDEIASLINNTVNPSSGTGYLHFSIPAFDEGRTPSLENGGDIESNKFSLPGKCILVSKLNPQFQRVWLVFDERANKISSTEFLPFVPKKTCSYELLYEILRSDAFYAYMCNCSSSSTGSRKRMPPELCLEYKIAFPKEDSDLLERFRVATASILSYLAKIPGESKRLTELRDFLLPLLMNGQVTIGDDGK